MLDKEYKYYESHKEELIQKYAGKFIVIVESKIVGDFDSREEALTQSVKKFKIGTFLIQEIKSNSSDETMMFHSQVAFI